jgi:hypothetical protein
VSGVRKKTQKLKPEHSTLKPEIWCLEFDILQFSITLADGRKRGKSIQAPSGGSPKSGPLGRDSLLLLVE